MDKFGAINNLLSQKPCKLDLSLTKSGSVRITGLDEEFTSCEIKSYLDDTLKVASSKNILSTLQEKKEASLPDPSQYLPLEKKAELTGVVVDMYEVEYPTPQNPDDETKNLEAYLDYNRDFVTQYTFPGSKSPDVIVGLRENLLQNETPRNIYKKWNRVRGTPDRPSNTAQSSKIFSDLSQNLPHANSWARLKPSKYGVGVFAIRDIPKGTIIFPEDQNTEMHEVDIKDLQGLSPELQQLYEDFCPAASTPGKLLCPKNFETMSIAWYLNHSDTPNVTHDAHGNYIPSRDIKAGEELTLNYADTRSHFNGGQPVSKEDLFKSKLFSKKKESIWKRFSNSIHKITQMQPEYDDKTVKENQVPQVQIIQMPEDESKAKVKITTKGSDWKNLVSLSNSEPRELDSRYQYIVSMLERCRDNREQFIALVHTIFGYGVDMGKVDFYDMLRFIRYSKQLLLKMDEVQFSDVYNKIKSLKYGPGEI